MPKNNVYSLPRKERPEGVWSWTEDGQKWEIPLKGLTHSQQYEVIERVNEMVQEFITGADDEPPKPFFSAQGYVPRLSRSLFAEVAAIEAMQTATEESERYRFDELVHMADALPEGWLNLIAFANALSAKAQETYEKKEGTISTEGTTEQPSESVSTNSDPIPSISSEPTPSLAA